MICLPGARYILFECFCSGPEKHHLLRGHVRVVPLKLAISSSNQSFATHILDDRFYKIIHQGLEIAFNDGL